MIPFCLYIHMSVLSIDICVCLQIDKFKLNLSYCFGSPYEFRAVYLILILMGQLRIDTSLTTSQVFLTPLLLDCLRIKFKPIFSLRAYFSSPMTIRLVIMMLPLLLTESVNSLLD